MPVTMPLCIRRNKRWFDQRQTDRSSGNATCILLRKCFKQTGKPKSNGSAGTTEVKGCFITCRSGYFRCTYPYLDIVTLVTCCIY